MHSSRRGFVIGCEYEWSHFGSCYYLGLNLACVCYCEIVLVVSLSPNAAWMESTDCLLLNLTAQSVAKSSSVGFRDCN